LLTVRKRAEFQEIQSRARRIKLPHFVVLLYARAPRDDFGETRLGITASRKVGNAVVRNRCKRLIRVAFRATRDLWATDLDLVVIVRRALDGMKADDVVAEWRTAADAIAQRSNLAHNDRTLRESKLADRA
jgi:ribonuclease P protein component